MKLLIAALVTCVLASPVIGQTLVDGSGAITTAGTSQQVFPYNAVRRYIICQNPIAATELLLVNVGAAAGAANGSIELAPGGSWSIGPNANWMAAGPVSVTAATAGHRFICKQG